jgi:hypothetical protein
MPMQHLVGVGGQVGLAGQDGVDGQDGLVLVGNLGSLDGQV